MRVGFIGAGKVGFSLGRLFAQGGIQVIGYFSRHAESAEEAAALTDSSSYDHIGSLAEDCDAIFITVPDGVIPEIFEELKNYDLRGRQICHCSGSMTAEEAFPGIAETGAAGCSIHPLFPVSDRYESYRELKDAFFCIEGNIEALQEWKTILEGLGPKVQMIAPEQKRQYHAACAVASNLVCGLVQESLDLLEGCGFSRDFALEALTPLMKSNMEHLLERGPVEALTGPVERNDVRTVQKHLEALPESEDRELYRAVSVKLIEAAQQRHPLSDYSEMKKILRKEHK